MTLIVTGGAGFIGSELIRLLIEREGVRLVVVDSLTYAGNLGSIRALLGEPNLDFHQVSICDASAIRNLFNHYRPDGVIHLAAESHVDRSIDGPGEFFKTNIEGTYQLLETARQYLESNPEREFRFHHVSTDEVYGDLGPDDPAFTEETSYAPSSPYSATKASADLLVRSWGRTYGLPFVITNCSNNYGPRQFPEKLIPHMILNALSGKPLPVYGDGHQVRDWLHVEDHAEALIRVFFEGRSGRTYNIGGNCEVRNIDVVKSICRILDNLSPGERPEGIDRYEELITYVKDRPGHDRRYAINGSRIKNELGWEPKHSFDSGLDQTVKWYLENREWWEDILSGNYRLKRVGGTDLY